MENIFLKNRKGEYFAVCHKRKFFQVFKCDGQKAETNNYIKGAFNGDQMLTRLSKMKQITHREFFMQWNKSIESMVNEVRELKPTEDSRPIEKKRIVYINR